MIVTESYDVLEISTLELNDVVCLEDRYGMFRLGNHQGSHELLGRVKTNHFFSGAILQKPAIFTSDISGSKRLLGCLSGLS